MPEQEHFQGSKIHLLWVQMFRQNSKSSLSAPITAHEKSPPDRSEVWVAKLQWHSQLWEMWFFFQEKTTHPSLQQGHIHFCSSCWYQAHIWQPRKGRLKTESSGQWIRILPTRTSVKIPVQALGNTLKSQTELKLLDVFLLCYFTILCS